MASGGVGLVARQFHRLFGGGGTVAGLTEIQLLERFLSRRDEAAFEALMVRYGPMVLSVCRQLLDDPNDVDDAFQATFLVFVRKASSLRRRELLGNWLYGVAHKVARRSRADAAKRRQREKSAAPEREESADHMAHLYDLQPLHEELAKLPENYRAPVVLCYLEGLSHEEAARRLAWPLGSVKGRLSRARDLLRERLIRRGVAPPAGALLIALGRDAKSAVVPDPLRISTIRAATAIAAGKTIAAGTISATSTALAEGVIQTMFATKLRLAAATLLTAALMTTGAGAMAYKFVGQPGQDAKPKNAARDQPESAGRVPGRDATGSLKETIADRGEVSTPELPSTPSPRDPIPISEKDSPRLRAAKELFNSSSANYDNGTITIDRVVGASQRLAEAEENANAQYGNRPAALDAHLTRMKKLAELEKLRLVQGVGSQPNYNLAAYAVFEAQDQIAQAKARPTAGSGARTKNHNADDDPTIGKVLDPEDDDLEEEMNQAIRAMLNKPISIPFADETPLEDVIKYIKAATVSPRLPEGIPVYVDPIALQNAEKTLTSPVQLALEGVKLKRTLRILLKQLDLGYAVEHGFLTITNIESEEAPWSAVRQIRERSGAMGSNGGGMGGGLGGPGIGGGMGGPGMGGAAGRAGSPGSLGGAAPGAGGAAGQPGAGGRPGPGAGGGGLGGGGRGGFSDKSGGFSESAGGFGGGKGGAGSVSPSGGGGNRGGGGVGGGAPGAGGAVPKGAGQPGAGAPAGKPEQQ
jgi:RNA polymerase sigma factor (sigma-70 family)